MIYDEQYKEDWIIDNEVSLIEAFMTENNLNEEEFDNLYDNTDEFLDYCEDKFEEWKEEQ